MTKKKVKVPEKTSEQWNEEAERSFMNALKAIEQRNKVLETTRLLEEVCRKP